MTLTASASSGDHEPGGGCVGDDAEAMSPSRMAARSGHQQPLPDGRAHAGNLRGTEAVARHYLMACVSLPIAGVRLRRSDGAVAWLVEPHRVSRQLIVWTRAAYTRSEYIYVGVGQRDTAALRVWPVGRGLGRSGRPGLGQAQGHRGRRPGPVPLTSLTGTR